MFLFKTTENCASVGTIHIDALIFHLFISYMLKLTKEELVFETETTLKLLFSFTFQKTNQKSSCNLIVSTL